MKWRLYEERGKKLLMNKRSSFKERRAVAALSREIIEAVRMRGEERRVPYGPTD